MSFNIGEMVSTGSYTLVLLTIQCFAIIVAIKLIASQRKKENKIAYILLFMIQLSVIFSMFYHYIRAVKIFKLTYAFQETVFVENVLEGLKRWQIFFMYEIIIGSLLFCLIAILLYKHLKSSKKMSNCL